MGNSGDYIHYLDLLWLWFSLCWAPTMPQALFGTLRKHQVSGTFSALIMRSRNTALFWSRSMAKVLQREGILSKQLANRWLQELLFSARGTFLVFFIPSKLIVAICSGNKNNSRHLLSYWMSTTCYTASLYYDTKSSQNLYEVISIISPLICLRSLYWVTVY